MTNVSKKIVFLCLTISRSVLKVVNRPPFLNLFKLITRCRQPYALWENNKLKQLAYGKIWTSNQRTLILLDTPPPGGVVGRNFPHKPKIEEKFSHKGLKFSLFLYILRERFRCFKWPKTVKFPGGFAPGPPIAPLKILHNV